MCARDNDRGGTKKLYLYLILLFYRKIFIQFLHKHLYLASNTIKGKQMLFYYMALHGKNASYCNSGSKPQMLFLALFV